MGKILFIRGGAVGDFILTMPAIQLVRDSLPNNEIEILGYESIAKLAVASKLADRVRSIEHASLAPFFAPGAKLDDEWVAYFKSFDVVVSYLFDPDGFFAANLEQAGVQSLLVGPYQMDESEPEVSASRQLATPLEQLALFLENDFVELDYGATDHDFEMPISVVIHPGSGSPKKNWSVGGWANLTQLIEQRCEQPVQFLITSGEAEDEIISEFLEKISVNYKHLPHLDLPELASVIANSQFYFGNDSGIGHLAATTGIHGVILFGSSNPKVWAPTHPNFEYVVAPNQQLGNLTADGLINHALVKQKLFTFQHP